jgi:urea transporter
MASVMFAVAPLTVFLWTGRLVDRMAATIFCLSVSIISLIVMRVVEKEMYEVLKGMRRGTIWFNNT